MSAPTSGVLRVDDVRAGTALSFAGPGRPPRRVVVARALEEVVPALELVQAAVAAGSWALGMVAYEAAPALDAALVTREPDPALPLVWFALTDAPEPVPVVEPAAAPRWSAGPWTPDATEAEHAGAVAAVRERIARGETYQVNLTLRLSAPFTGDAGEPGGLYADLLAAQRCSHGALLDLRGDSGGDDAGEGAVVVSASPEAFVEVRADGRGGRRAVTRPMKGTAPRGRSAAEDALALQHLADSPKERAENVMIVDLMRNDLQRVCAPGSVEVTELLAAEEYPTVHQVVSTVEGDLLDGTTTLDLLRALFPCGSVTGAPKASTMRAVAELELSPRGAYCGTLGWLAPPGEPVQARFSVAIRTAVVTPATTTPVTTAVTTADGGGRVTWGTGSGITWDSRPRAEHRELLAKARVLSPEAQRRAPFGLLETLARVPGPIGLRDVEHHLARLAASAAYCGIPCDVAGARTALDAAVQRAGAGALRVRLELAQDGALSVTTAAPPPPASPSPVRLVLDGEPRVASTDWWPRHKTTRRAWIDALRGEHRVGEAGGPDEVAWTNERGEVCEASTASLAVRLEGRWWTPPVECGLLPGVLRGRLLESGRLDLRVLSAADLHRAEALAVLSSLRGWRPAVLVRPVLV